MLILEIKQRIRIINKLWQKGMTIQNWLKLKSVKMIKSYKIKFKSINVWIHSLDSCSGDTVENHLISGTWSCFSVFNGIRSLGLSCTLQLSPHYKITHHKNFYCSPKIDLIWFAVVLHLHYNNVRLFRSSIASTLQQCPHYYPFFISSYTHISRSLARAQ